MSDKAIIEAAARAVRDGNEVHAWGDFFESETREISLVVLAAVNPLIRAAALEEAAQTAFDQTHDHPELMPDWNEACEFVAAKVRALKEQP